jgi:phage baseplate assembly protein gpV
MAKLVCTVEMSKDRGVTVKVENADASITQTITMDGTTLTLKVAGSDYTSTFTQKADSIAIKCKDFSIEADETLTCTSGKATRHESRDILTLQSREDMTLTSSAARLVQSAESDVTVSGANVTATARTAARMTGMTAAVTGDESLSLTGKQASLSGAQVAIKADTQLGAESSGVATLGGSVTTLKGSLINAG